MFSLLGDESDHNLSSCAFSLFGVLYNCLEREGFWKLGLNKPFKLNGVLHLRFLSGWWWQEKIILGFDTRIIKSDKDLKTREANRKS